MMLSPWLQTLLLPAAAASSLVLALATLVRGRGRLELTFVAGQLALAAESLIVFSLLRTEMPSDRLFWLELQQVAALIVPLPWVLFVAALVTRREGSVARERRIDRRATGASGEGLDGQRPGPAAAAGTDP